MKNILFIVVDSVTNNNIFNSKQSKQIAPFLNELREKSISGDNMYSEAPYTEAALMSLLGSFNTLDNRGYLEKFKNKESVIDIFRKNGYKTYFPGYYPSIYPSYMRYGAEDINYIELFNINHVWEYRLVNYRNLFLENKTSEEENNFIKDILDDNFKAWIKLLDLLESNSEETILINDCVNRKDIKNTKREVEKEYSVFKKNKENYINELFKLGTDHNLFKIKNIVYIDKVNNDDFRKWFIEEYTPLFKKIKKIQFKKNVLSAKLPFKKLIKNINNKDTVKGIMAGYKNLLLDKDLMDRISPNYDLFKAQRSFRSVSELTINWIEKNKNNKQPWMAYVHIDDAHYRENFFTYDTCDKSILKEEFNKINNYINNLPKGYCGTIASDLSLLYCDSIIKNIYDYLSDKKLLDNTSIVITADHGYSYYFNPIREKYVISSYKENYNVPFIIYDKDIKSRKIKGFLSTKDIPATLISLANIEKPSSFKGESLLNFKGRKFSTIEYMGSGCPDMIRRPMILGVRTKNYTVVVEAYLTKTENDIQIKEIYDMNKDPHEHINLVNKNCINIDYEIKLIKKRFNEIKENYDSRR